MNVSIREASDNDIEFARVAHHKALELYRRLGFKVVEEQEQHYVMELKPSKL